MRRLSALIALLVAFIAWDAGRCEADFIFTFSPNPAVVSGPGPLKVPIDLVITHSGVGPSTILGFTIDVTPSAGITLLDDIATSNPLNFDFAQSISAGRVGFGSLSDIDIGNGGTATVTTLDFLVDGTISLGTFAITATLFDASRGGFKAIPIGTEVTVTNGSIDVTSTLGDRHLVIARNNLMIC
jgi:hypothetical protein